MSHINKLLSMVRHLWDEHQSAGMGSEEGSSPDRQIQDTTMDLEKVKRAAASATIERDPFNRAPEGKTLFTVYGETHASLNFQQHDKYWLAHANLKNRW